jgi:hypothetical protein
VTDDKARTISLLSWENALKTKIKTKNPAKITHRAATLSVSEPEPDEIISLRLVIVTIFLSPRMFFNDYVTRIF